MSDETNCDFCQAPSEWYCRACWLEVVEESARNAAERDSALTDRDEARAELQKTRDDFSSVWESRDEVVQERERARQACNAYWHDLSRIGSLCEQSADEYPLKAVERTVREFRESRRDFVRVADALGLVSTDDTGRIGQVASVDEVVAASRSIERLRAEVEMLRGIGCREAKEGEPESGPCGVCLKCAEERGAKWALDSVGWSREDDRRSIARRVCVEARKESGRW